MTAGVSRGARSVAFDFVGAWPLILGFAVLAIPTAPRLADQAWSQEFGAYGPIILCTGAWLVWRQLPELRRLATPGNPGLTAAILIPSLVIYVFGRAYDFLSLEAAGVYGAGLAIVQSQLGVRAMLRHWFPFFYLAFAIPPPGSVLASVTAPLKEFVSLVATNSLHAVGIPVAREGVTIYVAQYQLLVEDACSGMNSIVGLVAVSLLYIYLLRGSSWRYSLVLAGLAIPIAIIANILRIMTLVLLTYFYGDEVAQGFLHFTAGMFLFAAALLMVFGIDRLIFALRARRASAQ
ncbi:MAG: exosortase V [Caulobacteraceae bacterium]